MLATATLFEKNHRIDPVPASSVDYREERILPEQ
jgi:hypothetical protein